MRKSVCVFTGNQPTFNSSTEPRQSVMGDIMKALNTIAKVIAFEYSSIWAPFSALGSLSCVNSLMGSFSTKRCTKARTICTNTNSKSSKCISKWERRQGQLQLWHDSSVCCTNSWQSKVLESISRIDPEILLSTHLTRNEALDGKGQQNGDGEEHTREVHQVIIPAIVLQQIACRRGGRGIKICRKCARYTKNN